MEIDFTMIDNDDEHFCLKCKSTISGLDNYVLHRKRKCQDSVLPVRSEQLQEPKPGPGSDQSKGHAEPSADTAAIADNEKKSKFDFNQEHLEAMDFFQSLQLQNTKQTPGELTKELPREKLDDLTFFESIGLYWVNPADKHEGYEQDSLAGSSSKMKLWDQTKDEGVKEVINETSAPEIDVEADELDFLHVLGLTPVGGNNLNAGIGKKWRLWNPEDDAAGWAEEMLCSELYLPETAANDPTLMEDQVHGLLEKPLEVPDSEHYCDLCQRFLSTKDLYRKHLMSELHFKKSAQFELDQRPKRKRKRPKFFDEDDAPKLNIMHLENEKVDQDMETVSNQVPVGPITKEIPKLMECTSCKAKVLKHQYGKHLISHYHYHRSLGHQNNQEVILEHIGQIVRQSPFQCQACSFYCNWHEDFVSHMKDHDFKDQDCTFWCQVCMKVIHSNKQMMQHLKSYNHTELVSVINRSVPVIIKMINLVQCEECERTFRFNLGLKKHMQICHGQSNFELPDQHRFKCQYCPYYSYKVSALKSHQFLVHPNSKLKYDCYICKKQFTSKETAIAHRNSLNHKLNLRNKEEDNGVKMCTLCNSEFFHLDDLKEHMEMSHVDELPQCHLCGVYFHLPQEIPEHLKTRCNSKSSIVSIEGTLKCHHCPFFTTNKESLLALHAVHKHPPSVRDSIEMVSLDKEGVKDEKFKNDYQTCVPNSQLPKELNCTSCSYTTSKKILLNLHVKRQHQSQVEAFEKCNDCGACFKLKTSLNNHMKIHRPAINPNFICNFVGCDFKCNFKSDLERHKLKHSNIKDIRCNVLNCEFKCKRKSELLRHSRIVHENLPFLECKHCEYRTRNKCHMNRHLKIHEIQEVAYYEVHLDENDFMVGKHEFATPPEFVTEQVIDT